MPKVVLSETKPEIGYDTVTARLEPGALGNMPSGMRGVLLMPLPRVMDNTAMGAVILRLKEGGLAAFERRGDTVKLFFDAQGGNNLEFVSGVMSARGYEVSRP